MKLVIEYTKKAFKDLQGMDASVSRRIVKKNEVLTRTISSFHASEAIKGGVDSNKTPQGNL